MKTIKLVLHNKIIQSYIIKLFYKVLIWYF